MIASPCINVCKMDEATGLCRGCLRTLDEIARWSSAPEEEQRRILAAVAERRRVPGAAAGATDGAASPAP